MAGEAGAKMVSDGLNLLIKYFPQLTEAQRVQFATLEELYRDWNAKINVISRQDMGEFWVRHVLHSLAIARVCSFGGGGAENVPGDGENVPAGAPKKPVRVLDVGTGGGFPSIPLAIMFPGAHFTAVDSIGKKIKVVSEVAAAVGLSNLTAINGRAEAVEGTFDYVVSRAVAPTERLLEWVWGKIERGQVGSLPGGMLLLKGGDLTDELAAAGLASGSKTGSSAGSKTGRSSHIFDIADYFSEEFFATKKVVYIKK